MNVIAKSILVWGIICLVGFGVYQFTLGDPNFPQPLMLWSVLTFVGVAAMVAWIPKPLSNKVLQVWLIIAVGGMLYHWLFFSKVLPALIPSPWAYWALLMAIGFLATGYLLKNTFWYGVGVLNAVFFLLAFFAATLVADYASALLGIVSGVPMIYYGLKG